jgi:hypothetical protein
MKKYLCSYSYSGMETEGRVDREDNARLMADSKGESIYKYICFLKYRSEKMDVGITLAQHLKESYAEGGWGYGSVQLHDSEEVYLLKDFENAYSDLIKKQRK